jgi:amino acid transporter
MEERSTSTSLSTVGRLMVYAVGVAGVYYCLVILASGMAAPWQTIAHQDLAAAAAFRAAFKSDILARAVLVAGLFGAITVGNGTFLAGSRLLFALGRAGIIGREFSRLDARFGTPTRAVLFVGVVAAIGTLFGRKGIGLVVDAGSAALAFVYVITCLAVVRLRRLEPDRPRPYRVPGGVSTAVVGVLAASFLLLWSFYDTGRSVPSGIPAEWWVLGAWAVLGAIFWWSARGLRALVSPEERARLISGRG